MTDRAREHRITIPKTVRYYTLAPSNDEKPRLVLFAMHGYRQLGRFFIRRFEGLEENGVMVIAPEAPNRFYIEGYSGKVGASWMTKEAREDDIADQLTYLNALKAELWDGETPIAVLGFSQGGPTACRWLAQNTAGVKSLILHSTVFPNDFDFNASQAWLNGVTTTTIFGDDDFFAPEQIIEEKMRWLKDKGVNSSLLRFKGGHQIHLPTVKQTLSPLLNGLDL